MSLQLSLRKQGQGMVVRTTATVILIGLLAFGCNSLSGAITADWWLNDHIIPTIPFFEFVITNGQLISFVVFLAGCFGLYVTVINHPEVSDFLIETESELRKVSWPEHDEFLNATIVVLIAIFLIAAYLGLADILSKEFIDLLYETVHS